MSDLRRAALAVVHAWDTDGPVSTMEDLRAALAQPEPVALQEVERLRAALRYEENRFSRISTHGPDCWKWGPSHYECALRQIDSI